MNNLKIIYYKVIDKDSQLAVAELNDSSDILVKKVQLNNNDKNIYSKINHEIIKVQWLTIRLLINKLLDENKHVVYNEHDKPSLSDESHNISISHTNNYVAVIISKDKHAGIDIELRNDKVCRIKNKFLNRDELESIEKENGVIKYLLYWNAKETLYKHYGKRNLIFKENILLSSFVLNNEGHFGGRINTKHYKEEFVINYRLFDDFTMTWCLK
jgi:phosphopantetheinyl transferase